MAVVERDDLVAAEIAPQSAKKVEGDEAALARVATNLDLTIILTAEARRDAG
jgi:hypothetical protein